MVTQILQGNENNLEQIYSWKSSPGITKISSSFDHSFIHSSKTVLILDNESKESSNYLKSSAPHFQPFIEWT